MQYNSIKRGVERLVDTGIVQEVKEKKGKKFFIARELMNFLSAKRQR